MRKGTKIAIAAGALALAGAAGVSSLAIADYRGHQKGERHAGYGGHHGWGHHGHHGKRSHGRHGKGKFMHRMFERFDTNEDGKLTQQEIDDARKALLAKHDGDKDGKLTLAEYEKLWLEVKRRKMVRSFQRTDTDGDASVTVDEFLKPYSKIVERMDRNEDGALDKEDRKHRRYHHRGGDSDKKDRMEKRDG